MSEYLPRFQSLCERCRFKSVYLANYQMAMSDLFAEFARCGFPQHRRDWDASPRMELAAARPID